MNNLTILSLLFSFASIAAHGQVIPAPAPSPATAASSDKNSTPAEVVEPIIVEGTRDPENLPKKKKTTQQIFDGLLNKEEATSGITKQGMRYECVKDCKGPFCCAYSAPARSVLSPDTEHK